MPHPTSNHCQRCDGVAFLSRARDLPGAPALCVDCHEAHGTEEFAHDLACDDGCPLPVDHDGLCFP
ncbi:hypothetical protein ACFVP0_27690 [Streptomyces cinereoruber]|uniref:hypothetical protein n=1 Tax=Streptomyces cinereoruber TaxID=67260 RepID=UPI0036CB56E0